MEVADKVIQANQASNNNPLVYSPISEISYIGRVTKDTDEAMELIKAESLRRRLFKEGTLSSTLWCWHGRHGIR